MFRILLTGVSYVNLRPQYRQQALYFSMYLYMELFPPSSLFIKISLFYSLSAFLLSLFSFVALGLYPGKGCTLLLNYIETRFLSIVCFAFPSFPSLPCPALPFLLSFTPLSLLPFLFVLFLETGPHSAALLQLATHCVDHAGLAGVSGCELPYACWESDLMLWKSSQCP